MRKAANQGKIKQTEHPRSDVSPRAAPTRRLVVLGASNVARSFSTIVETARETWPDTLDVLAVLGHGRSYGMRSHVLGRGLPGILQCGMWRALDRRPQLPATGLLTDIGNDILYGIAVPDIVKWIEQCLQRLRDQCGQLVVTQLPLEGLRALHPAIFRFFRGMFFPGSRLTLRQAQGAAEHLNECIIRTAERYGATLVEPRPDWYGLDPIHIRRNCFATAWREVFDCMTDPSSTVRAPALATVSFAHWRRLYMLRPEYRTWLGIAQRQQQPVAHLDDGTCISLF